MQSSGFQPALRVVVATLQHCLAKARLAIFEYKAHKKSLTVWGFLVYLTKTNV